MSSVPSTDGVVIRRARPGDERAVHALIRDLAVYEKLEHEAVASVQDIRDALFAEHPRTWALLAEEDGLPLGFALYFQNFSTFLGRPGIYLEDLFVEPAHRGRGIGRRLLQRLAVEVVEARGGRLEWAVLDWNRPAIDFYRSLGAVPMDEWTVFRLAGDALERFAAEAKEK